MNCLVTGNLGYIGYILSNSFLEKGYEVVGYDYGYFPKTCFGRRDAFEASNGIRQITKDIRRVSKEDLRGMDAVIHLAALPNDPTCDINPKLAEEINHYATVKVAKIAKEVGVSRFIFSSSCSIYGAKGRALVSESDKAKPITAYGISKLHAEKSLLKLNSKDFSVTCMRNATCYGVSPRMRLDMVLNSIVASAYVEGKVRLLSNGKSWRPLVHIEDVASAFILALNAPTLEISGEILSVGSEDFQIIKLAEEVKKGIPGSRIEYAQGAVKDERSYNVSFDKIRDRLGFRPKWNVKRGIKELYNAYDEFGMTAEKMRRNEFWAAKYFKHLMDSGKVDSHLRFEK